MKRAIPLLMGTLFACQTVPRAADGSRGHLIAPSSQTSAVLWSEAERAQPLALRNLRRSAEASFHVMRVAGSLKPQTHRKSDLVLMTMAGSARVRVGSQRLDLGPGDVLEVPRDTPYSLEGQSASPGVMYLVYTPPLADDDKQTVDDSAQHDAWKWNVWVQ